MPPEFANEHYTKKADVWSLGIILSIFLCGYPPFEGDDSTEIFRNVLKQELKFDDEHWRDISMEAKDLIK